MMNAEALPLQVTLLSNFDPEIMTKRFNLKKPNKIMWCVARFGTVYTI